MAAAFGLAHDDLRAPTAPGALPAAKDHGMTQPDRVAETHVTIEVICESANCSLTKRGSWGATMRSAVMIAAKHHKATGHRTFARLTQETVYE